MVGIHFEERCHADDDYGKQRPIRLFESREAAIAWLLSVGYKEDGNRYVQHQYHSEMHANIHEIVGGLQ
jgi:hypothetical protein